jgi:hypothetical protein
VKTKAIFEETMKRFSIIFLITVLCIVGYFEISLSHSETLFWLNLNATAEAIHIG